jgi:lysozyme
MRFNSIILLCLLTILSCAPPAESPTGTETSPTEDPNAAGVLETSSPLVLGIDISHHCDAVDFSQLKPQGLAFVFCKATEGNDWQDPLFHSYFEGLLEHDLIRGAYHFYVVGDDPLAQAQNFIQTVTLTPSDLPPVVDIESMHDQHDPTLASELKLFLDTLERHFRKRPVLYTGVRFWNQHIHRDFSHYPLWLAEYGVETPTLPEGWNHWHFWQKNQTFQPKGVLKAVDFNVFNGTQEQLKHWIQESDPRHTNSAL